MELFSYAQTCCKNDDVPESLDSHNSQCITMLTTNTYDNVQKRISIELSTLDPIPENGIMSSIIEQTLRRVVSIAKNDSNTMTSSPIYHSLNEKLNPKVNNF